MKKISISKLFGRFTYDIQLNDNGLTIITGPNGYGKSTILRCIHLLSKGDCYSFEEFANVKFESFVISFSEKIIKITNESNKIIIDELIIDKKDLRALCSYRDELKHFYSRRVPREESIFRLEFEYDEIYESRLEHIVGKTKAKHFAKLEKYLESMKILLGNVYFVKEQRLIRQNKKQESMKKSHRDKNGSLETIDIIEKLPSQLKELILAKSVDYSNFSADLDSSYPSRLFDNKEKIDEKEFVIKNRELQEKYNKLHEYGLVPHHTFSKLKYQQIHERALYVYFDDFNKKYKFYNDFVEQLDLFVKIINSRLNYKNVHVSKENGFVVIIEGGEADGKQIHISELSSGEKQEIALFYEIIFNVKARDLLLIDEPEISLHVAWQNKFMDDLMLITKRKNLNVIVATHSPQIIGKHRNNQIDLGGLYDKFVNR